MSKTITGREKEQKDLNDALLSNESELIAIYGRRRVGKTFLIREYYKVRIVFDMTGIKGAKKTIQLRNFHRQLKNASTRFKNVGTPKDWFEAFDLLKVYLDKLTSKKKEDVIEDVVPTEEVVEQPTESAPEVSLNRKQAPRPPSRTVQSCTMIERSPVPSVRIDVVVD